MIIIVFVNDAFNMIISTTAPAGIKT